MRAIAAAAGCDPALIIRYFSNKQALFTEAVDLPLDTMPPPAAGERPDLATLAASFLAAWDKDLTFTGLLRSSATHPEAAAAMRGFFDKRVGARLAQWCGGSPEDAAMLGAMLIGLAWGRNVIGLEALRNASIEEMAARLAAIVAAPEG